MQCPHCQSDDVIRSRRRFWERFVLPVLSAQVHRCRDCRHRFLVGAEWGRVVLGGLAAVLVGAVIVAMVLARQNRDQLTPEEPPIQTPVRKQRRVQTLPPGLPPPALPAPSDPTSK
jgi:hypothetical protein